MYSICNLQINTYSLKTCSFSEYGDVRAVIAAGYYDNAMKSMSIWMSKEIEYLMDMPPFTIKDREVEKTWLKLAQEEVSVLSLWCSYFIQTLFYRHTKKKTKNTPTLKQHYVKTLVLSGIRFWR